MLIQLKKFKDPRESAWFDSFMVALFCCACCVWLMYGIYLISHGSLFWAVVNIIWSGSGVLFWLVFIWETMPDNAAKSKISAYLNRWIGPVWKRYVDSIPADAENPPTILFFITVGAGFMAFVVMAWNDNGADYNLWQMAMSILGILIGLIFWGVGLIAALRLWEKRTAK